MSDEPTERVIRNAIGRYLASRRNDPEFMRRLRERIEQDRDILDRLAEHPEPDTAPSSEQEVHECVTGPLCDGWPFAVDDAYRTIAAVAWPGERKESRDGWAVTMRDRPGLFEKEARRARERLNAAIAHGRAALRGDGCE